MQAAPWAPPCRQEGAGSPMGTAMQANPPAAHTGLAAAGFWQGEAAGAGREVGSVTRIPPPRRCRLLSPARGPGPGARGCHQPARGSGLRTWARAAACTPKRRICNYCPGRGQHGGGCGNLCLVLRGGGVHGKAGRDPKCCRRGHKHLNKEAATVPGTACCCQAKPAPGPREGSRLCIARPGICSRDLHAGEESCHRQSRCPPNAMCPAQPRAPRLYAGTGGSCGVTIPSEPTV